MAKKDEAEQQLSAQEKQLLEDVPAFKAVGNTKLRTGLAEAGWDEDTYWEVRDALIARGVLVLGRGRGGSVRRALDALPPAASAPVQDAPTATRAERSLYKDMKAAIEGGWAKNKRLGDKVTVEITAHQGARSTGGKWTRPDIILANYKTFDLIPGKYFDLVTFEVKPYKGLDVTVVYEALAHRRCATRSYALIHIPQELREDLDVLLEGIESAAERHGVGLIVAPDPADPGTWEELVEAVRHKPDPELMNDFLAQQPSQEFRDKIKSWF